MKKKIRILMLGKILVVLMKKNCNRNINWKIQGKVCLFFCFNKILNDTHRENYKKNWIQEFGNIKSWLFLMIIFKTRYCVKSVQLRSYFWSVFSCIQSGYRKIQTRNNSVVGHFSRSGENAYYLFIIHSRYIF